MNKLNRRSILVLVAVLSMPYAAHAASIEPKSWELNGFVSFQHTSVKLESTFFGEPLDITSTVLDLEPGVGYFLTSNWEILGNFIYEHQTVSSSFGDSDDSTDQFGLKASTYFHIATTGAVIPFVGIGAGVFGGDYYDDTSYILPEAVVGIRWPFRDVISFNFTGGYRRAINDGNSDHADQFFIGGGFSVFLQGGAAQ